MSRPLVFAILFALTALPQLLHAQLRPSDDVRVCQVGYLPNESKFAMLTAQPSGDAIVRRASDDVAALTVHPSDPKTDVDSGDAIRVVDFSKLTATGDYYLDVPGLGASHRFHVGDDAFAFAFRTTVRSYYGQRCGIAVNLAPDFPQFHHDLCHTEASFHESSGKSGTIDVTGGWHDAGDFGRYVVNSGITTATLLWAFELNAPKLAKLHLDLPESGGKIPDYLAEVKWNLDWMLKMQDADGGVWHKASSASFCGFVMPEKDPLPALVIGSGVAPFKTTTATADLAAVAAIASRTYRPFDPAYADRCLAAAERAWQWIDANPDCYFENPKDVHTGGYGDRDAGDERLWAAAELFRSTGKPVYNAYFLAHYTKWTPTIKADSPPGWPNLEAMAMFTYALCKQPETNVDAVATIKRDALAAADAIVKRIGQSGYRVALNSDQYIWGSNSVVANYAMVLRLANHLQPKQEYVDAAQDQLHYLLGRNGFNGSFVTHLGAKWPMHPHHRPSAADGVDEPWPGLMVGGPNSHQGRDKHGDAAKNLPVAKVWFDDQNDYVTNEIAINWNAPLVFILAEALPN